jgi:tripartite-type tricarboxylate transporter receptor subunit TctC
MGNHSRRSVMALIGGAAVSSIASHDVKAQAAWPSRPVRWILPFGAGSGVDVGARLLTDRLAEKWGQPVVVDNRPGGDGIIAMTAFLNANDDHVLLYCGTGSYTVHPYQIEKLPYDFQRDLAPLARVANTVMAITTPASMKLGSLKDLVALAKAEPGKLNAAVPQGISELVFDGFVKSEGLNIQKVPYKDVVQAVPDLVESRINIMYTSYAVVRPVATAGTAKVLAIGAQDRVATLPEIPTAREAGVPSFELDGLSGLFGPAKMPMELRKRIGADIVAVMQNETITSRLAASGQTPAPGGPEQLDASVQRQVDQVDAIAKLLGMARK